MGSFNTPADSARGFFLQVFTPLIYIFLFVARIDGNNNVDRLLIEVDHEGYPTWFLAVDRTLLSELEKGGIVQPNIIVAKDGSGQFKTVQDGINSYPNNYHGRYVIYVKAGIYNEYIIVDQKKNNILLYGDGPTKTIITGHKSVHEGLQLLQTPTFSTLGQDFIAMSIAFENTAGPEGKQAIALHVRGDRSAFFNCAFLGYQDTLYVEKHRQFYRHCEILVADGTSDNMSPTGIVLQNCSIMPDAELLPYKLTVKTFLARPWKAFSRAVFINNYFGDFIQPDGYMIWNITELNIEHSYFAEFGNTGPGANAKARVKWAKGLITKEEAARFTAEPWLNANTWLPSTGIPYDPSF